MKRTGLFIAAMCLIGLSFAGCGDDSTSNTDIGTTQDLAGRDLSASGTSCLTIVTCAQACGASAPACVQGCVAAGSTASQAKYAAVFTCGITKCLGGGSDGGSSDGGAGSCTSATDTSTACLTCTAAAAQSAACATELAACTSS